MARINSNWHIPSANPGSFKLRLKIAPAPLPTPSPTRNAARIIEKV